MENKRKSLDLKGLGRRPNPEQKAIEELERRYEAVMKESGIITIKGKTVKANWSDFEEGATIGDGNDGQVVRAKFGGILMAVKRMGRPTTDTNRNKRIIMDLEVITKATASNCLNIVYSYGYFVSEYEVKICMELMATCLDRLLKKSGRFPEKILGKTTVSVISALDFLKRELNVIHRDVKPSNILLDYNGNIKLCDFGISGILMESKAMTRDAGCKPYMAPERLKPVDANNEPSYDIRSDVWSFGVSLVELATARFPFAAATEFDMFAAVEEGPAPRLQEQDGFTREFCEFVANCLQKNPNDRPKYPVLMAHHFYTTSKLDNITNVGQWFDALNELKDD